MAWLTEKPVKAEQTSETLAVEKMNRNKYSHTLLKSLLMQDDAKQGSWNMGLDAVRLSITNLGQVALTQTLL